MPVAVAALETRLEVLLVHHATVLVDVGHASKPGPMAALKAALETTETTGEGEMLLVAQALLGEHQHGVAMPGIFDCRERGIVQAGEIDLANRCPQSRAARFDLHSISPISQP